MSKFATNSWQAREALVERKAYTTNGAMRATEGPQSLPWGNRLPAEWQERYNTDAARMTYVVWSYLTPIAWVLDDGSVVKVDHKWSRTTTGHQGLLYALDASRETRAGIYEAAQRERQQQRDRRAERREESSSRPVFVTGSRVADGQWRLEAEGRHQADLWEFHGAARSTPEDYDNLIGEVQGMLVR